MDALDERDGLSRYLVRVLRLVPVRAGSDEQQDDGPEGCEPAPVDGIDQGQPSEEEEVDRALVEGRHEADRQLGPVGELARAVDQPLQPHRQRVRDSEDLSLLGEASRFAHACRVVDLSGGQVPRRPAPRTLSGRRAANRRMHGADHDPRRQWREDDRRRDEGREREQ